MLHNKNAALLCFSDKGMEFPGNGFRIFCLVKLMKEEKTEADEGQLFRALLNQDISYRCLTTVNVKING